MGHQILTVIAFLAGFVVFLLLGVLCTFYPGVVQRTEKIGPINLVPSFEFLRRYKARPEYIVQVRITGILALLGAGVGLYALAGLVSSLMQRFR